MSDLISRESVLAEFRDGRDVYDIMESIEQLPSADRPTGEVDAVAIYEKAEHDLEHGRITLGEFEKRIEPLKHLYYDRPTGEWIEDGYYDRHCVCSNCGGSSGTQFDGVQPIPHKTKFCPNCGAKMGGGE